MSHNKNNAQSFTNTITFIFTLCEVKPELHIELAQEKCRKNTSAAPHVQLLAILTLNVVLFNIVQIIHFLTSGYKADRQNSPNDKHYLWLSSPFQRLGSVYCRLHSSPLYRRALKTEEHRQRLAHLLFLP